ncbi:hypothetical protein P691DRAFT_783754 [Macrolepiota fuliginosa MF-IS2]|uniref:Uncharacterized protein n=1 Tax=Macrolepiota fuliginosa MF-IS2 TaxID=1400762 RepID=A0A9P5WWE3_9AGAR|nr:hypothetical protein P691DRAFT_783754 [Macrolepiota fuliginosa MF-IS2]
MDDFMDRYFHNAMGSKIFKEIFRAAGSFSDIRKGVHQDQTVPQALKQYRQRDKNERYWRPYGNRGIYLMGLPLTPEHLVAVWSVFFWWTTAYLPLARIGVLEVISSEPSHAALLSEGDVLIPEVVFRRFQWLNLNEATGGVTRWSAPELFDGNDDD